MTYCWQTNLSPSEQMAAAFLPPPAVEETGWDTLLALHWDQPCKLSLEKLACLISVPQPVLDAWLASLEECGLITGVKYGSNEEIRAVLTPAGRELLDQYLSATAGLQLGTQH